MYFAVKHSICQLNFITFNSIRVVNRLSVWVSLPNIKLASPNDNDDDGGGGGGRKHNNGGR